MIFVSFSRNWLLNAVPAIGTHTAVRFLKEKFIAGELSIPEAAQALIASVHLVTADIEAVRLFEASQPQYSSFTFQDREFQGK